MTKYLLLLSSGVSRSQSHHNLNQPSNSMSDCQQLNYYEVKSLIVYH